MDVARHTDFKKWLRYFLDFCSKYSVSDSESEQVRLFIQKLQEKKQTPPPPLLRGNYQKIGQGDLKASTSRSSHPLDSSELSVPPPLSGKRFNEWRCLAKSKSSAWDKFIYTLAEEIKTRHYSRKTLKTYADWIRKFQNYLRNKSHDELSSNDIKAYLAYLAVNCKIAASTQNQAFNTLLFLFRHVLKKDFVEDKDIPRAKKSKYIPVVLSKKEIDAVLKHIGHPYDLAVILLYG